MRLFRSFEAFGNGSPPLWWPKFEEFVAYDSEDLNSTARFLASLKDALPLLQADMGGESQRKVKSINIEWHFCSRSHITW